MVNGLMNGGHKNQNENKQMFKFLPFFSQFIGNSREMSRDANDGPMNDKMGNDQYCLRWNSYETNILSTFENLLDSEALSDVTLFCEGQSFKAHRLVLAACSTHFSKLFSNSPLNGQLIVILDGTRQEDLLILLQFMYRGVAYLHQDRIESVLRTAEVLQVKGLSDGGVEGVSNNRNNGPSCLPGRTWTPPPSQPPPPQGEDRLPIKNKQPETDMDTGPLGPTVVQGPPRSSGSPRPSGRIAMPADSPLSGGGQQMGPPNIFPGQGYPGRHPLTSMSSMPSFGLQSFGFRAGPDNVSGSGVKPTSTSTLNFPSGSTKSELPSPGPRNNDTSQYSSKFDPIRGERERDDLYESGSTNHKPNFEQQSKTSPKIENNMDTGRERSPNGTIRRPSSSDYADHHSPRPKLIDSTTGVGVNGGPDKPTGGPPNSPGQAPPPPPPPRIYDDDQERAGSGRSLHDHVKSERISSPVGEPRRRSYSGEYNRENLSRLSNQSTTGSSRSNSVAQSMAAQDLRTSEHEERMKRETNLEKFETLRRIQAASVNFARENSMATIQKLEMFNQARETSFLTPGGFSVPLTAPLGIPASDLARIAETVPDPAGSGEPSSGTGTKLKCPFCERTYGYETNLRAHIRQRHQGIRVPCPFCHRSFTRNNTVRRHIAREHRHQVNPTQKFGSTKVMPDQPFQDHMNLQTRQPQP